MMETNLLKDWYIEKNNGVISIVGRVYNDIKKRFADGAVIRTSQVLKADFVNGIIETKNSVYHLEVE